MNDLYDIDNLIFNIYRNLRELKFQRINLYNLLCNSAYF